MTTQERTKTELRRLLRDPTSRKDDIIMPTPTPADLDAIVDHQDQQERQPRTGVDAGILEDAAAVLQLLDRPEQPNDHATLSMPIGYFIDADGTRLQLGVVEIDVKLHVPGVLEALAGKPFKGMLTVPTRIEHRFTDEGAAAIRALAGALPQDDGDPR